MKTMSRSDARLNAALLCVAESMAVEAALVAHRCNTLLLSLIGSSYVDDSAIGSTTDLWFVPGKLGSTMVVKENKGATEAMDGDDGGDIVDEDEDEDEDDDDDDDEDYDSSDGDEAGDGASDDDDDDDDDDEEAEDSDDDDDDEDDEESDDEDEVLQQPPSKKMK